MPRDWAFQLCERFHLSLPPDVAMWLDEELWKRADLYIPLGDPISPVDLLNPGSHRVWGGQHLPDTLPLFDDGSGNVTCLRVRGDGSVSELLLWQTDGQWQPLGETLVAAVLYSYARRAADPPPSLPSRTQRPWWRFWGSSRSPLPRADSFFMLDWALEWLPDSPVLSAYREAVAGGDSRTAAQALLEAEHAEIPLLPVARSPDR